MTSIETAAILYSDLVGSTKMEAAVGPDRADELRREHFEVLRRAVAEAEGVEVKNTGDGLMVAFKTASAAVGCAVAMQQLIDRRNQTNEDELHIRVGIGMGEATVEDGDYFGMPSIEGARLCDKASDDGVLAAPLVQMMAARSDRAAFKSVGKLELKGIPEPLEAFEVAWEPLGAELSSVPLPGALQGVPAIAYAGRRSERESLASLFKEALGGDRRAVLISGEPGIGKTRLASHTALEAHAQGATVLLGAATEDLGAPYAAWIQALNHYVEHAPAETLAEHVKAHGGEISRLARNLQGRLPDAPAPRDADPETERFLLFDAVASLLESAAAQGPLVVVLDDLHSADKETVTLLKHVVRSVEQAPLLLIVTYRDSDLRRGHPLGEVLADLRRVDGVQRLSLGGLGAEEVAEIMASGAGHAMDEKGLELAQELAQESDGNPFFVTEILRHLIDSGALRQRDSGGWVLEGSVADLGLPESVLEVVGSRVESFGEDVAKLLGVAAVIGRDFDVELLAALVEQTDDEVLELLDTAVELQVLTESTGRVGAFSFTHALFNHTLYDGMGATRRARLHRQVAEAIEERCGDEPGDQLSELAFHWSEATIAVEPGKAVDYARRAGERALAQLAPDQALRWFGAALEQVDAQEDGAPSEVRCDLLIGFGEAQRQTGDIDFRQTLLEASAIAGELEDAERAARAALANSRGYASMFGFVDDDRLAAIRRALELDGGESPTRRARLLGLQALELGFHPDYETRRAVAEEALGLARETGDRRTLAYVLRDYYHAYWAGDTIDVRAQTSQELLELTRETGDMLLEGQAEAQVALVAAERGEMVTAKKHLALCMELAESLGQPGLLWHAHYHSACFALAQGRLEDVDQWMQSAAGIGNDGGEPDVLMIYGGQVCTAAAISGQEEDSLGLVEQSAEDNPGLAAFAAGTALFYCRVGREDDARAKLREVRGDGFDLLTRDLEWTTALDFLAKTAAELGDTEAAAELYPILLPLRGLVSLNGGTANFSVEHCLGILAATQGDHEKAEEHFAAAAEFESRAELQASLAATKVAWATSLLSRGGAEREERARLLAAEALDLSREGGYPRIERAADGLLAEPLPA